MAHETAEATTNELREMLGDLPGVYEAMALYEAASRAYVTAENALEPTVRYDAAHSQPVGHR